MHACVISCIASSLAFSFMLAARPSDYELEGEEDDGGHGDEFSDSETLQLPGNGTEEAQEHPNPEHQDCDEGQWWYEPLWQAILGGNEFYLGFGPFTPNYGGK